MHTLHMQAVFVFVQACHTTNTAAAAPLSDCGSLELHPAVQAAIPPHHSSLHEAPAALRVPQSSAHSTAAAAFFTASTTAATSLSVRMALACMRMLAGGRRWSKREYLHHGPAQPSPRNHEPLLCLVCVARARPARPENTLPPLATELQRPQKQTGGRSAASKQSKQRCSP